MRRRRVFRAKDVKSILFGHRHPTLALHVDRQSVEQPTKHQRLVRCVTGSAGRNLGHCAPNAITGCRPTFRWAYERQDDPYVSGTKLDFDRPIYICQSHYSDDRSDRSRLARKRE